MAVKWLKAFLMACSQSVSGNNQELVAHVQAAQKSIFSSTGNPVSKEMMQTLFFHPSSPFPCDSCKSISGGICTASQVEVQLPLLYTV